VKFSSWQLCFILKKQKKFKYVQHIIGLNVAKKKREWLDSVLEMWSVDP